MRRMKKRKNWRKKTLLKAAMGGTTKKKMIKLMRRLAEYMSMMRIMMRVC